MITRPFKQQIYFLIFRVATTLVILFFLVMILIFVSNGIGVINLTFLTDIPREGLTKGGILPAIIGTLYITLLTIAIVFPIGVLSATYMTEYARESRFVQIISAAIINLAGISSIVYGLFGFGLFVLLFGFGRSVLSGALTLFIMVLPIVIVASREAILSVPDSFREASLALGATKWQTVRHNVLPNAIPGILTGTILAIVRAAGETAPLLTTAAFFYKPSIATSPFDGTMTLSTHIYYMATQHPNISQVRPIVYGTALVLLAMVLSLNMLAIVIRSRHRRRRKW